MSRRHPHILLFIALFISIPAFAAAPIADSPPAAVQTSVSASAIQWIAAGGWDRIILRIGGPDGFTLTKEFEAGRMATLRMSDLERKADGTYTWELRFIPRVSSETRQRLMEARDMDDDAAIARIRAEAHLDREEVQSGAFTIMAGSFVAPREEPSRPARKPVATGLQPAPTDVVTADDSIIQGSLCVGLDCIVNESFGFDTIRLKENNTRIKFDDTSAAGFPANDWQLTANDSAGGGLNKFSIEDVTGAKVPFTVQAGAPTNSMFIDSSGRLGLRTSTPVLDLHIATGNTPAIRQEQTAAGGWTAQTWDIGANESNWFVRDVTGGSRLPLRIRPGAPTSSIDIAANGNVGMGTSSPKRKLHVIGPSGFVPVFPEAQVGPQDIAVFENNGNINFTFISGAASTNTFRFTHDGATSFGYMRYNNGSDDLTFGTNGIERVRINSSGYIGIGTTTPFQPIQHSNGAYLSAGGIWTDASSRDLKQDIRDLDAARAKDALDRLTPVTFAYKLDPDEHHAGFIAEDVPDLVASKDRKGLSAMDVAAVLTKVIQDQQKTIEELKARIEKLENK